MPLLKLSFSLLIIGSFLNDDRLRRAFGIHRYWWGNHYKRLPSTVDPLFGKKMGRLVSEGNWGLLCLGEINVGVGVKFELSQQVNKVIVDNSKACGATGIRREVC